MPAKYNKLIDQTMATAGANAKELKKALKEGLIVITAGSNVLRFVPPLIIEKAHVDEMVEKLKKALENEV